MTLWRKARTEAAGAWRSVRYDLSRTEPDAARTGARGPHPDVTSTGFHTFGGSGLSSGPPRPRRLAAVSAFGILAVAGAAGSYFAVVSGLGSLAGEQQADAEPYPLAAEAPRGSEGELANSGLGRGTASATGRVPAEPAPVTRTTTTAEPAPKVSMVPATTPPSQPATAQSEPVTTPDDCCLNPPVPTPTVPVPTPYSPSATPSASASPSASEPEPSESPSPAPSESPSSADPSATDEDPGTDEGEPRHHRRH